MVQTSPTAHNCIEKLCTFVVSFVNKTQFEWNSWEKFKIKDRKHPLSSHVKNGVLEHLINNVLMEGLQGNLDIEDMVVDWLLDRLLHKLRNARGPEGDEAKKRIVTKVLNHDKLKEIGESQLKLSFVSKRYDKSAQFFNAVVLVCTTNCTIRVTQILIIILMR